MAVFFAGILFGVAVYTGTATMLGTQKANRLPGGAIGAGFLLHPFYVSIPGALAGHLGCVVIAHALKK